MKKSLKSDRFAIEFCTCSKCGITFIKSYENTFVRYKNNLKPIQDKPRCSECGSLKFSILNLISKRDHGVGGKLINK